jgi:hypothetical protein
MGGKQQQHAGQGLGLLEWTTAGKAGLHMCKEMRMAAAYARQYLQAC